MMPPHDGVCVHEGDAGISARHVAVISGEGARMKPADSRMIMTVSNELPMIADISKCRDKHDAAHRSGEMTYQNK